MSSINRAKVTGAFTVFFLPSPSTHFPPSPHTLPLSTSSPCKKNPLLMGKLKTFKRAFFLHAGILVGILSSPFSCFLWKRDPRVRKVMCLFICMVHSVQNLFKTSFWFILLLLITRKERRRTRQGKNKCAKKKKNYICWDGYLPEELVIREPKLPITFWSLFLKGF